MTLYTMYLSLNRLLIHFEILITYIQPLLKIQRFPWIENFEIKVY